MLEEVENQIRADPEYALCCPSASPSATPFSPPSARWLPILGGVLVPLGLMTMGETVLWGGW
jgi:hypothetical protein